MKIPMRPELPTACAVDNSASIQPARSLFILWGKTVQISGATSVRAKVVAQKSRSVKRNDTGLHASSLLLFLVVFKYYQLYYNYTTLTP